MRILANILVIVILAVVVSISLGYYFLQDKAHVWTNDAFIEGFSVDLSSNITEEVVAIFCDEGDFVKKGQVIAQFRSDVIVAKQKAQKAKIEVLKQEVDVKEAFFKKVENDYIRALEGFLDEVISAQSFDHAEKNFEMADAELKLSLANLKLATKDLEVIEAELTHYTVTAPQDGTIAKRWIWPGDVTTSGQSLFTMYDLEHIWVTANLEETKMKNIRLGNTVTIEVDAYPGYTFEGEIFTIKGAAASQFSLVPQNNATGNYTKVAQRIPLKMTINRPNNFPEQAPLYLFPGMNAEVYIKVQP